MDLPRGHDLEARPVAPEVDGALAELEPGIPRLVVVPVERHVLDPQAVHVDRERRSGLRAGSRRVRRRRGRAGGRDGRGVALGAQAHVEEVAVDRARRRDPGPRDGDVGEVERVPDVVELERHLRPVEPEQLEVAVSHLDLGQLELAPEEARIERELGRDVRLEGAFLENGDEARPGEVRRDRGEGQILEAQVGLDRGRASREHEARVDVDRRDAVDLGVDLERDGRIAGPRVLVEAPRPEREVESPEAYVGGGLNLLVVPRERGRADRDLAHAQDRGRAGTRSGRRARVHRRRLGSRLTRGLGDRLDPHDVDRAGGVAVGARPQPRDREVSQIGGVRRRVDAHALELDPVDPAELVGAALESDLREQEVRVRERRALEPRLGEQARVEAAALEVRLDRRVVEVAHERPGAHVASGERPRHLGRARVRDERALEGDAADRGRQLAAGPERGRHRLVLPEAQPREVEGAVVDREARGLARGVVLPRHAAARDDYVVDRDARRLGGRDGSGRALFGLGLFAGRRRLGHGRRRSRGIDGRGADPGDRDGSALELARQEVGAVDHDPADRDRAVGRDEAALDPDRVDSEQVGLVVGPVVAARRRGVGAAAVNAVLVADLGDLGGEAERAVRGGRRPRGDLCLGAALLDRGLEAGELEVRRQRGKADLLRGDVERDLALVSHGHERADDRDALGDPGEARLALDLRAPRGTVVVEADLGQAALQLGLDRRRGLGAVVAELERGAVERDLVDRDHGEHEPRRRRLGRRGLDRRRRGLRRVQAEPEDVQSPVREASELEARAVDRDRRDLDLVLRQARAHGDDPAEVDLVLVGAQGQALDREVARVELAPVEVRRARVGASLGGERERARADLDVLAQVGRDRARVSRRGHDHVEGVDPVLGRAPGDVEPEGVEDPGRREPQREARRLRATERRDLVAARVEEELALERGRDGLVFPVDADVIHAHSLEEHLGKRCRLGDGSRRGLGPGDGRGRGRRLDRGRALSQARESRDRSRRVALERQLDVLDSEALDDQVGERRPGEVELGASERGDGLAVRADERDVREDRLTRGQVERRVPDVARQPERPSRRLVDRVVDEDRERDARQEEEHHRNDDARAELAPAEERSLDVMHRREGRGLDRREPARRAGAPHARRGRARGLETSRLDARRLETRGLDARGLPGLGRARGLFRRRLRGGRLRARRVRGRGGSGRSAERLLVRARARLGRRLHGLERGAGLGAGLGLQVLGGRLELLGSTFGSRLGIIAGHGQPPLDAS